MKQNNGMTIIAGCGRLGAAIAGRLSDQKQDVLVLDIDKSAFRKLTGSYGGLTAVGSATDLEKLASAGLAKASVFIAVTDLDCVNICAAQIAKSVFHVPKVVTRVYDEEKTGLLAGSGIETICLPELAEREVAEFISLGGTQNAG